MGKLTENQKQVLRTIYSKLRGASYQMECGRRNAIINLNDDQLTMLHWAVQEYGENRGFDVMQ